VSAEVDERPLGLNALPQLSSLPPGVLYVCDATPHRADCSRCQEQDLCSYSKWDAFRVKPGVALPSIIPECPTLSGLSRDLNSIVLAYLGRFCTSTYIAYINPAPRENFCNYCRAWGHQFDFISCTEQFEQRKEEWDREARAARYAERSSWLRARTADPA
jgi:hypothetical protein